MPNPLHNELKKEFQLERLILFSDAVFAIAITLLVIEIKVPLIPKSEVTDHRVLEQLGELIPKFFGFIISFLIIGNYWIVHHRLFGFVMNYDARLLRLNLLFLFSIALMPFSTGFYSEYVMRHIATPVVFYAANIFLLGLFNLLMWLHVRKPGISEGLSPLASRFAIYRAVFIPAIFIVAAFTYLYYPLAAAFFPVFIPLVMRRLKKRMEKQMATAPANHQPDNK